MDTQSIFSLALIMHQGKPTHIPAMKKVEFEVLLDTLYTLRKQTRDKKAKMYSR